jgi:hypothetical protein
MDQHTKVGVTPDHPRLAAALEYAAFGWTSFPVPVGTKKSHKNAGGIETSLKRCVILAVPTAWTQSLHTKRGVALRVNARLDAGSAFKIEGVISVADLPTELGFTRGDYDWKIPEGPAGAIGFLAYHPDDKYSDHAFLSGGCSLPNDIYDDAWHRVGSSNYDQCRVNIEVGPVGLDYEEAVWDRAVSKFLYILDLELVFTRQEDQRSQAG